MQPHLKELKAKVLPKEDFSGYNVFKENIGAHVKSVIVFGVAAHCCVYQSVVDLLGHGLTVHLVVNATTTHNQEDR